MFKVNIKDTMTFLILIFCLFFLKYGYLRVTLSNLNEILDSDRTYQYK